MKKLLAIVMVILLTASVLAGCSSANAVSENDNNGPEASSNDQQESSQPNSGNMGITVNKINFETVTDESTLPKEVQNAIGELKSERGYAFFKQDDGYLVVITMGEKKTGGYDVEVKSVQDNEGHTNITVEEKSPAKDAMVITSITYPYTVVKMSGVTDNFNVVNQDNEAFELLNVK